MNNSDMRVDSKTLKKFDRVFRALLLSLVFGAVLIIAVAAFCLYHFTKNSIVVINQSGRPVHNVEVRYNIYNQSEPFTVRERKVFLPDERIVCSHRHNDLKVTITFTLNGKELKHVEGVDLWTGETYILRVEPQGFVTGRHGRVDGRVD